jgi:ABC-2 type transport system ATP-binding protein
VTGTKRIVVLVNRGEESAMMIEARRLTRTFRVGSETVEAVRGLDLEVGKGEMVAVLGPNGAGKSTTLRMLTTLLQPTSGVARVVGRDVTEDPAGVRQRIGYIGQGNSAGHTQKVMDELVAQGRCYGLGRREAGARGEALLTALDLEGLGGRKVSTLSGGQRRRLDVALGMVHRPALLFLDEPSTGLDPQNRLNLQEQVEQLRSVHGTTIVLTTHYLDEADALADRVVVVDHGVVIADDTPERLKNDLAGDHVVITAADDADVPAVAAAIERTGGVTRCEASGTVVTARVHGGARRIPGLLRDLDRAGVEVAAAEVRRPTLDDVFLTLTGRSLREGADPAGRAPAADVDVAPTRPDRASAERTITAVPRRSDLDLLEKAS